MDGPVSGRLFGIETEYGLLVEGGDVQDLVEESRLLVRAYPGVWAGPWDSRREDPRADLRGFRADRLHYDRADARFDRAGHRLPAAEQRADRALANGARLYNDHGHPEYATPECCALEDAVAHDRAGERIVLDCARIRARETGGEIRLFKNNTDFHGASYGCHESYLCDRALPFERLLYGMLPFLVTRIIFTGAGKAGVEGGCAPAEWAPFQLSQRADFCTEVASVDTLARRPLFNTRDEPHADPRRYRRLHVISGDANMSEFATALKLGTACLILGLLEAGWEPLFRLRDPLRAFRSISRDPSLRRLVELEDGRTLRATDIQRIYLRDAQKLLAGADADADWTLRAWSQVLDDLERQPSRTEDRLDWAAKRSLLETYREAEGAGWDDPVLRSLDLEYHQVDPERGLYYGLEQAGRMHRLVTEAAVERAREQPPCGTRAAVRGALVRRFGAGIGRLSWGAVVPAEKRGGEGELLLPPFPDPDWQRRVDAAKTLAEAAESLDRAPASGDEHVPDQG